MIYFNNDYMYGAHPEVLKRLGETNSEPLSGYGTDPYTRHTAQMILEQCQCPSGAVHFFVGGTPTNATVIDALLSPWQGVLATDMAHIAVHEAGAIEAAGHKVLTLPHQEGKLLAEQVRSYWQTYYQDETYEHMVSPGMVYISHPTEIGTLYTKRELQELAEVCRACQISLFLDGARLLYALATPENELSLPDLAQLCDAFYIGGTKAGALFGEALVVPSTDLFPRFRTLIKQHGALLAKGWLIALQMETLLANHFYLQIAGHAIEQARRIRQGFLQKGYRLYVDSPTNQQFFWMPNSEILYLRDRVSLELWGAMQESETPIRLVTHWGTKSEEVDQLLEILRPIH